ncbi:MAG: restriction endonuclease subunit S [Methylobacter sp.]
MNFDKHIGFYPSDWLLEKIGYFGDFYSGGTPSTTVEKYWHGDIIWLVPSDLSDLSNSCLYVDNSEMQLSLDGFAACSTKLLPKGTVCLSSRATIGEVTIAAKSLCTNQGFINVVTNDKLNNIYFLYWIKQNKNYIKRFSAGTTFLEISRRTFKRLTIAVPESEEQKAISGLLFKVDEAIAAVENSIKAAERLKKSLMQNLLTGKLKPDGNRRNNEELMITKYGMACKSWKYCQIKDLIKEGYILQVQDGNHGEVHPTKDDFVNDGIPFVMASDIASGFVDTEHCKKIPITIADKLRIGFAKDGDVLLSHKASIGYTCIAKDVNPYFVLTPQVTYYRCDSSKLMPEYLLYFFQQYNFQNILEGNAKQSTRNYIGITNQKKLWIYLPETVEEQAQVIKPLAKIDSCLKIKRSKIVALKNLKKSLMQNLLTGKKRINLSRFEALLKEMNTKTDAADVL